MIIWLAILIPISAAVFLYWKYQHKTLWWEFLIPFGASIALIFASKALIEHTQTRDTEYWGGILQQAEYYEAWDERVPCSHPNPCTCFNKDGRCTRSHGNQHLYDVAYHPPYWQIIDSNNIIISISKDQFESLAKQFGNRVFHELHRFYHSIDGDKYVTTWNNEDHTLVPVTTTHSYENRVAVSDSIFNFPEVNPADYQLYDYPVITNHYHCNAILGSGDSSQNIANTKLNKWNAKIGATSQVRMIVLVFEDQPIQAGFDQESYWKGGNKNEFVVTIGVDKNKTIQWCHPFSWTEIEGLKVDVRDQVINQKRLRLEKLVDWMGPQIQKRFKRKQFADFNYLSVEPPGWALFLVFIFVAGLNGGISYWIIHNEHQE